MFNMVKMRQKLKNVIKNVTRANNNLNRKQG